LDGAETGSAVDANGCGAVSAGNKANGVGEVSLISDAVGVGAGDTASGSVGGDAWGGDNPAKNQAGRAFDSLVVKKDRLDYSYRGPIKK